MTVCSSRRGNHPGVIVYNQDCNDLLKHTVESRNGKRLRSLRSIDKDIPLPALPMPGDVDIIMGGPPCQAFSGMNRYKVCFG